ncbi:MAG: flavodoxin family protein [bacterium]|nr:flavodoxin family protein [bacterium]
MSTKPLRIVAISGSPVKDGNMEVLLNRMLRSAGDDAITTELLKLSGLNIQGCTHCNFCLSKQKPHRYCSLKDDGQMIYEKIENADIIVLGSPVYFMRTSVHNSISPLGASAVASTGGTGSIPEETRHGILEDKAGLKSGEVIITRAIDLARRVQ